MEHEIVARQKKNSRIVRTRGVLPKSKKNTGRPFCCSYGHGYYLHIGITNYFVLIFL